MDEAATMFSWLLERQDLDEYAELRARNMFDLLGDDPRLREFTERGLQGLCAIVREEFGTEVFAALDRVAASGMTIAEEILDEELDRMSSTARTWLKSLVASYQSLYEIRAKLPGKELQLRDVIHGDVVVADVDPGDDDPPAIGECFIGRLRARSGATSVFVGPLHLLSREDRDAIVSEFVPVAIAAQAKTLADRKSLGVRLTTVLVRVTNVVGDALGFERNSKPSTTKKRAPKRPKASRSLRGQVMRLEVVLRDSTPRIWRHVDVPADVTLPDLHTVLQRAMGWQDSHLHMFVHEQTLYTMEIDQGFDPRSVPEDGVRLDALLNRVGDRLEYEYDFGDGWTHDVVVKSIAEPDPEVTLPRAIAGERACPPEDIGGIGGYEVFLDALADPKHVSHDDYVAWIGSFDPDEFDLERINAKLARTGAKRRPRKSKRASDAS
ncbi:MAG: plasmid pRiA4b ORF-3 family protein [Planctomycetes bacterium]|nr:plasmid pRiA4b ORF-3 family protein [Planctomycetota bacterium]